MAEDWGLAPVQVYWLTFALIGATALLTLPGALVTVAGHDAWLSALVGIPVGAVPLLLWYDLDRRLPGKTFTQQARIVLGPFAGTAVAVLPVIYFASAVGVVPREVTDLVVGQLPQTPLPVLLAVLMLTVIWIVRSGPEALVRAGQVLVPAGSAALLFLLFTLAPEVHAVGLLPVLARGWHPVLQGAAMPAVFYSETFFLMYFLPFRGAGRRKSLLAALAGMVSVALLIAASTAVVIALFGPLTVDLPFTVLQGTFLVNVAEFITHLDSLLVVAWLGFSLVKLGAFVFCFCLALAQLLGLRDYRAVTLPAAAFAVIAAMSWLQSSSQLNKWIADTLPFYGGLMQLGPPMLVWAAALLRNEGDAGFPQTGASASDGQPSHGPTEGRDTKPTHGDDPAPVAIL